MCLWTDWLSNNYLHSSLPIFTKFCIACGPENGNLVGSTYIICEKSRKSIVDFRGLRLPNLAVFRLWTPCFSTYLHKILCRIKMMQRRLCLVINKTRSRNRILEFLLQFRLMCCWTTISKICYRLSSDFIYVAWKCGWFDVRMFMRQTRSRYLILDVWGFQFLAVLGSGHHVFQLTDTKFPYRGKIQQQFTFFSLVDKNWK